MKRKGKLFAVMFLSLAMIFTMAPLNVMAEDVNTEDGTLVEESAVSEESEVKSETPAAENVKKTENVASGPVKVETNVTGDTETDNEEAAKPEKPKTEEPAEPKEGDTKPVAVKAVWHPVVADGKEITQVQDQNGKVYEILPVTADSGWVSKVVMPENEGDAQKELAVYEGGKWKIRVNARAAMNPNNYANAFGGGPDRIVFTDKYGTILLQGSAWGVVDVKYKGESLGGPDTNFGMLKVDYEEGAVLDIYVKVEPVSYAEAEFKKPVIDVVYDGDDEAARAAIYDNIDKLEYVLYTPKEPLPDMNADYTIVNLSKSDFAEYNQDRGKNFEGIYLIDKKTGEYVCDDDGTPVNFKEASFDKAVPGEYDVILANYFRSMLACITDGFDYVRNRYPYTQAVNFSMVLSEKKPVNYTITYVLDGGTLNGQEGPVSAVYEENTVIKLPLPEKEGYKFLYWEGSQYNAGDEYTVTEDHTFTAKWERIKYTVTFDSKGGTAVDPQMVNWGEKATKPVDPLLEGHSFEGWYKDIDYSSLYNFDPAVSINNGQSF